MIAGCAVVRDRRHPREEEIADRFKKTLGRLLG
jgi:formimidoylglutamate deiminase